ncbi:ABC transporter permease [Undibacterium sp. Ren11W]|uniref:ABC transporter permease n=1 Tax=Undibacterium sp. Ren11W TaxID=3413045 RepID=UPI003BF419B6
MQTPPLSANITLAAPGQFNLSGSWTARAIAATEQKLAILEQVEASGIAEIVLDGSHLEKLDSVGVWILQRQLKKIRDSGKTVRLLGWPVHYQKLMELVEKEIAKPLLAEAHQSRLEKVGRRAEATWIGAYAFLSFIGESALALLRIAAFPQHWRWRMVMSNIQIAGFDALPIIGMTSFLLGIVVAYQGADQLKHYGANIFVVELVGYSMLREFSPLITAIIIAGRSGSAYAAQIGTMVVTEEIDAMRTIGITPIDLLVLPKVIALIVVLPLLTVFSDITGVLGGMIMARSQLDINFHEFILRFGNEVHLPTFLVGVGKAAVFAFVIAMIGCYQGFQTKANADSVGRQTTRSVVQSIFIVIVLDALFSVVLSILDL